MVGDATRSPGDRQSELGSPCGVRPRTPRPAAGGSSASSSSAGEQIDLAFTAISQSRSGRYLEQNAARRARPPIHAELPQMLSGRRVAAERVASGAGTTHRAACGSLARAGARQATRNEHERRRDRTSPVACVPLSAAPDAEHRGRPERPRRAPFARTAPALGRELDDEERGGSRTPSASSVQA